MDKSSLAVAAVPVVTLITLLAGTALPFIAASRPGHAGALKRISAARRKARRPGPGAHDAVPAGYLYVPCARTRYSGSSAQSRRWVQAVPITRKTAERIYYASDSWDRREAVVSPGSVSREQFETDTRYPAGVVPVPGDRAGPAGLLFFATREAAEEHLYRLYRGEPQRAEQAAPEAPLIRELRRAMLDAHPDRGGTAGQFIQARRRYQEALRLACPLRDRPEGTNEMKGAGALHLVR